MAIKYKIYIQTRTKPVEYTEYSKNLQLPFTISERADERYDSGTFTLRKLTREKPFNIESKVKIEILQNNITQSSYVMQIESDNVESFYLGNKKYYNHNISVIELTKKYDNIFISDFTITNPGTKTIVQPYEEVAAGYSINKTASNGLIKAFNLAAYGSGYISRLGLTQTAISDNIINAELDLTHIPDFKNGLSNITGNYHIYKSRIELPIPYCLEGDNEIEFKFYPEYMSSGSVRDKGWYGWDNTETWDNTQSKQYTYKSNSVTMTYRYKFENEYTEYILGTIKVDTKTGRYTDFKASRDAFINDNGKLYLDTSLLDITTKTNIQIKIYINYNLPSLVPSQDSAIVTDFTNVIAYMRKNTPQVSVHQNLLLDEVDIFAQLIRQTIKDYYNNPDYAPPINSDITSCLTAIDKHEYPFGDGSNINDAGQNVEDKSGAYAFLRLLFDYSEYDLESVQSYTYYKFDLDSETHIYRREESYDLATFTMNVTVGTENPTLTFIIEGEEDTYKRVRDLLEKINIMMEPEDRFSIDYSQVDILDTFVPERIYSKRNVSEILFDIGSLVSAYPYLDDNNRLTFYKVISSDNVLYDDINTNENIGYTFDNNVNTYMTNISNMISPPDSIRKHYSYWPDKRNFAYPNGDWKKNSITPDNNQIEISNSAGIYFLKYIKVKNCLKDNYAADGTLLYGKNTVIDITNFCPEVNYYNTLYVKDENEASNTNKSNCIYWTKGSNIINLDMLEAQEKTAIFGESAPENYKLQRAVFYAAKAQLVAALSSIADNVNPNTAEYQFQICYVDNIEGLVKTKKFNQEVDYEIMSNYNQMDNNINALDWMNTSQINLLRRGNTENNKDVYIRDLDELPVLGELKYNENNEKLFADAIDFNFDNNVVNVKMNYTKNYNKIDPAVSLDKDYRQYEIYGKEAVTRDIRIDRFVYMETDDTIVPENKEEITESYYNFTGGYRSSERQKTPSYMVLYFKDKDKKPLTYYKMTDTGKSSKEEVGGLLIPINITASGNSILMQGGTLDNYAVGYYSDITGENISYIDIFGNEKTSGARRIKEARYVDDLGEAEYVSVYILRENITSSVFNVFNANIFPKTTLSESSAKIYSYDYEENIHIKKDNREKLNFIYQIHFLTHDNNLKWSPALCKYMFYDQESLDELFRPNDQTTPQLSYNASYYNLKYNIGNDALLRYKTGTGKDVIDPLYVDFDIRPTSSADTINQRVAVASADYYGYALAYPKTLEVIFHYDKPVKKGETFIKPKISFKFYKNKV